MIILKKKKLSICIFFSLHSIEKYIEYKLWKIIYIYIYQRFTWILFFSHSHSWIISLSIFWWWKKIFLFQFVYSDIYNFDWLERNKIRYKRSRSIMIHLKILFILFMTYDQELKDFISCERSCYVTWFHKYFLFSYDIRD